MEKNHLKLMYLFILLQPIIDLVTALMVRFKVGIPSLGILVRGFFLLIMLIYVFFFHHSKYKKIGISYIILVVLFSVVFFATKTELLTVKSFLIAEITYFVKYFYYPLILISLFLYFSEFKFHRQRLLGCMLGALVIYAILLIIPSITHTSFGSYSGVSGKSGAVGWFYAANEISASLLILFPFVFYPFMKKINIFSCIILVISFLAIIILGTKAGFLGAIFLIVLMFLYSLFFFKKGKKKQCLFLLCVLLATALCYNSIPAIKNIHKKVKNYEQTVVVQNPQISKEEVKVPAIILLSSRDKFVVRVYRIYEQAPLAEQLFGIGFSNRTTIQNKYITKLIEMDFFDVFFRYGIVGFILYFLPLVVFVFYNIVKFIQKKLSLHLLEFLSIYSILIGFCCAFIAGHVFASPPVSFMLVLSCLILLFLVKQNQTFQEDKVTIFALHLGFGGIEQYISSLCYMLKEHYQIEIVSTYDVGVVAFLNPKAKITYLISHGPNTEKFKNALQKKDIISIFKEGWKGLKLLYLKIEKNIEAIESIDSKYVITTRDFHNELVGAYANSKVIKIATEHNHPNGSLKYSKLVTDSVENFDYFVLVSKELRDYYQKRTKVPCIYIPNVLENIPEKKCDLNSNFLISVGRFSKEKGMQDVIDVFELVHQKKKNVKLYLAGDGALKKNLENYVKAKKLTNQVVFTGFLKKNELELKLVNSSIFISCSYTESFGLAALEAMSYGLCVVAFDSAQGLHEVLSNQAGILVSNRNKEQMAEEILDLLNQRKKRENLSKLAMSKCMEYSMSSVSKQWIELLSSK